MAVSSLSFHFSHLPSTRHPVNRIMIQASREKSASLVSDKRREIARREEDGLPDKTASSVVTLLVHLKREILKPPDKKSTKMRTWPLHAEIAIDRAIINCRFFTLMGIAGSLVGSILCFVEGCFLMLESYIKDLFKVSKSMEQERIVHMVIQATDMFLMGAAMLSLGMGLYSMFIGFRRVTGWFAHGTNPFTLVRLKLLSACPRTTSIAHTKSRIGRAVLLLLQVGVLEKFKNVPLATGLDLACFAGALFFSSASTFLLSQLHHKSEEDDEVEQKPCQ